MLAYVVVIVFSAGFFDDQPEQNKTVIALFPATAGLELWAAIAIELDVILQCAQIHPMRIKFWPEDISSAPAVRL